jgi:predicted nuclease with TOPRIM domain
MLGTTPDEIIQVITMVALAVVALFMGIKKLSKDWQNGEAESRILNLMHIELERMSQQNTALSTELGRLHTEVINLTQQLQKLTLENQRLQTEVCALTEEISIFKQLSVNQKGN